MQRHAVVPRGKKRTRRLEMRQRPNRRSKIHCAATARPVFVHHEMGKSSPKKPEPHRHCSCVTWISYDLVHWVSPCFCLSYRGYACSCSPNVAHQLRRRGAGIDRAIVDRVHVERVLRRDGLIGCGTGWTLRRLWRSGLRGCSSATKTRSSRGSSLLFRCRSDAPISSAAPFEEARAACIFFRAWSKRTRP